MQFNLQSPLTITETRKGNSLRLVLPGRQLKQVPSARQTFSEVAIAIVIGTIVADTFASDRFIGFGLFWALLIFLVATIGSIVIIAEHSYMRGGKSRSEVLLGNFEIHIAELNPISWGRFRFDALAICRLRIIELPDRFSPSDSDKSTHPTFWDRLAIHEDGRFALVAEDVNGRRMLTVAVAYPYEVILTLAKRIKVELDKMRAAHHEELLRDHPGVVIPDTSREVPICIGDRFSIASANARKPHTTVIQLRTIGEKTEVVTPRGDQLESVRFLAHRKSLLIERQLLLGKIQTRIAADHLVAIQAQGIEYQSSDSGELIIEYMDVEKSQVQRLVLLQDFSFEEVAWVAAELRDACPPLGGIEARPQRVALRFSIAQIMFFTVLVAVICAPLVVSRKWGWLYAVQLVAILLCVTSFSGAKSLGKLTRRSWTMPEILAVGLCLCFLWIVRLFALLGAK